MRIRQLGPLRLVLKGESDLGVRPVDFDVLSGHEIERYPLPVHADRHDPDSAEYHVGDRGHAREDEARRDEEQVVPGVAQREDRVDAEQGDAEAHREHGEEAHALRHPVAPEGGRFLREVVAGHGDRGLVQDGVIAVQASAEAAHPPGFPEFGLAAK